LRNGKAGSISLPFVLVPAGKRSFVKKTSYKLDTVIQIVSVDAKPPRPKQTDIKYTIRKKDNVNT
jgi:hypothetical protein